MLYTRSRCAWQRTWAYDDWLEGEECECSDCVAQRRQQLRDEKKARANLDNTATITGLFGLLGVDELDVVADQLSDPLETTVRHTMPYHLLLLSSDVHTHFPLAQNLHCAGAACKGLQALLWDANENLEKKNEQVADLCEKVRISASEEGPRSYGGRSSQAREHNALLRRGGLNIESLRAAEELHWDHLEGAVDDADCNTLGMVMRLSTLPKLRVLNVGYNYIGGGWVSSITDEGVISLCENARGVPELRTLKFLGCGMANGGALALASACRSLLFDKLELLDLTLTRCGGAAFVTLAPQLRKLPVLTALFLCNCYLNDDDMSLLFTDLDKDHFKMLDDINLTSNDITDVGVAVLRDAILDDDATLPCFGEVDFSFNNEVTQHAWDEVSDALAKRDYD